MTHPLRKGPSGPLALTPDTAGGTVRVSQDGLDLESVPGTTPGQLWLWSGTLSRFSLTGPSNGQIPVWNALTNDWEFTGPAPNQFFRSAVEFDDPNNSNWAVNALAPAAADTLSPSLAVRRFDDFTEEGVGLLSTYTPAGVTAITFTFCYRAQTAPGAPSTVQPVLYRRPQDPNVAVPAWSSGFSFTPLVVPANAFFQESSQTVLLSTLGLSADQAVDFELTRNDLGAGLPGDWDLQWIRGIYS